MTNSTDKTNTKIKTKKAKGPIRFEAIIPLCIFVTLIYVYFNLFFDSHLRKGLELAGTYVHGAEVNIADIDSSFWKAYFQMSGIEVTNKEKPELNLIQIAKIRFELSWDALLRAKFVVNDATIENIMANSPRKKPGKILPKDTSENKALKEVEQNALAQGKEQFKENVLGDVVSVIGGVDPSKQLEQIQENLKSEAKIKELEKAIAEKKKIWEERINGLPQKPQIDALINRSKTLKFNTKDPLQFSKDLKELDSIVKEGDKIVKEFDAASKSLKSDVDNFNSEFKSLDDMVKEDIKDLQTRLKIPSIDVSDFSKSLFGKMFNEKLGKYKKYMALARQYMPDKKATKQKEASKSKPLVARKRSVGRNISFPRKKAYPLFWLQHGKISSKEDASEYSGNISGEIKNATTQPMLLGLPMTIDVSGSFPKQGILGLRANITVDHTTETPFEKMQVEIAEYPLSPQKLSDSSDVKLHIKGASGELKMSGLSKNESIQFKVNNKFSKVIYDIDAKSSLVKDVLVNVTSDLPSILVNAEATGAWTELKWKINSNLGDELSKGFKKEIQAKIDEAKKKLNDFVNNRIKVEKDKLNAQFNEVKSGIDQQINGKKKDLDKAKQQANNELNNKKKNSNKGINQEVKKAEKKLKGLLGL
ncbi:MAG: TIGR03545 family protein [Bdellovibrionaceae bacterium]|nr:TIGR03545 family protein [Pseudobdellovibrionaceae bacterium]